LIANTPLLRSLVEGEIMLRFICLAIALLFPAAAHAEWRRAESANFVVYSEGSEARLRQRILLLEDFDRLLRTLTTMGGDAPEAKLHVYFVPRSRDLRQIRDLGSSAAGFYSASAEGIAAFVSQEASDRQNEILFHEYAHHFMLQNAHNAYPAWYVEGFAEYFMTARFTENQVHIGNFSQPRASWLTSAEWLPWERVIGGTTDGLSPEAGAMYYAQAWLLTHYFLSTPERQASLNRYLAAAREHGPVRGIEQALGMDLARFGREIRSYISGGSIRFRRMQRTASAATEVRMSLMPAAFDDLVLHEGALRIGVPEARGAALLQAVRAAAARHPADPLAQRVRAHAEMMFGERSVAAELLDALIARSPNDVELLYLRGRLHLEAAEAGGDWDTEGAQARIWLARAHRADANHFQTLYRYAQSLRNSAEGTAENTMNVILLAHQLAPQVVEIRFNAAGLLIARGETEWAEALLRPLAADPHDRSIAATARDMIERARSRAAGAEARGREPAAATETEANQ
jgi:Flp pilus assembly protein TadD